MIMMFNLPSALSAPPRRFKMEGIQVSLVLMCKALLVLLQAALVQGDPGVDFVLTQSGINGYANETANEAFKDIENRISDHPKHFSTSYIDFITIWNIKMLDSKLPAPKVVMDEGKGMKVELEDTSLRMNCSWSYKLDESPTISEYGSVSANITGMNISIFVEVPENGRPTATKCKTSVEKLLLDFGRNSPLNEVTKDLIDNGMKHEFEKATCKAVIQSTNHVMSKKFDFLTPFQYGPLTLKHHENQKVTVGQNTIKVHLNGRFDGDSENLKFVDMHLPVKGMVNFAVSEEVVNSALRVWHKGTLAELSFVRNAKDFKRMFAYDWLVDEPLQIKIHTPIAPSASISAKGLLVSTHSSLELYLLDPKPGSTHSINVTFSASVLFEVSLNYKGLRVALQDYDLKALNSSDPEFILEKFDLIVARYRTMYLRIIREEFVMLIPLFHESYLKSAHLTVKDGFFQVFGELAHF